MEGFGNTLKELRIKRNLNQKQFAELLGISATRLNYWEKDKREPDLFNILKICYQKYANSQSLFIALAKYIPNTQPLKSYNKIITDT